MIGSQWLALVGWWDSLPAWFAFLLVLPACVVGAAFAARACRACLLRHAGAGRGPSSPT